MSDIWGSLVFEGNHDLIRKLHRVEKDEPGFGTIVVPREGFSSNDETHNMVIRWLKSHNVNILNPFNEEANLEYALKGIVNDQTVQS